MKAVLRLIDDQCEPGFVIDILKRIRLLIEGDTLDQVSDATTFLIGSVLGAYMLALDHIENDNR